MFSMLYHFRAPDCISGRTAAGTVHQTAAGTVHQTAAEEVGAEELHGRGDQTH